MYYAENNEHEILSTRFEIHEDLDACLIRTVDDMSKIVTQVPCLTKEIFENLIIYIAKCHTPMGPM